MLDTQTIVKILNCLIVYPYMFSVIEQDYADELEDQGLFSLDAFAVTAAGRDFLTTHGTAA